MSNTIRPVLAIHGGAGAIRRETDPDGREPRYRAALEHALLVGWRLLSAGGAALDAVEVAVRDLEDNPLFNAGRGSVFTHDGRHEMDASIMCGRTRRAGAVAQVQHVRNPIALARMVMDRSPHVFMGGPGAEVFAHELGMEFEADEYFFDVFRHEQYLRVREGGGVQLDHSDELPKGTVGAVAVDVGGNVAAATSTGGMTNKRFGRIGDSPVIGAGTYADNRSAAVSCTGHGEFFLRGVTAYDLCAMMDYGGTSVADAAEAVIDKLGALGGDGGLIAIDTAGRIAMPYNSAGMYRASIRLDGEIDIRIHER